MIIANYTKQNPVNMKNLLPFVFLFSSVLAQEKNFSINASIKGAKEGTYLYLLHKYDDILYTDSALAKSEKFTFKGKVKEPNMYWLAARKNANAALIFFVDGGKVEIDAHIDSIPNGRVKAGLTQDDYKASQELVNNFNTARAGLIQRHNAYSMAGNMEGTQRIIDSAQADEASYAKNIENFIKAHPNSNVGGYLIFSAQFDWPQIAAYDAMYNALGEKVKKGKFGKLALEKINTLKGTTIGYPALDFTQKDVNGKDVALSSYKGKYVLVDFWASWCGPCRRENPAVVAAYQKYKDKGFDVLGVSLDDNREKWLAAIAKDKLTWMHVSDLKGWQNAAGKLYGVQSIPFNLLLDKEGKIVAKGLRGPDLEAKLAELLGP
jgi:thiol-disulfide isomerase/thioredoxin